MEKEINIYNSDLPENTANNEINVPVSSSKSSITNPQLINILEDELKDMYWSEKAIAKSLPKMIQRTTSHGLIEVLETHLGQKEEHIKRVENAFKLIEKDPVEKKCKAMASLIEEAEVMMAICGAGIVCDAQIISAGQKVAHYEIGTYATLRLFAQNLGLTDVASILEKTLIEEMATHKKLAQKAAGI